MTTGPLHYPNCNVACEDGSHWLAKAPHAHEVTDECGACHDVTTPPADPTPEGTPAA